MYTEIGRELFLKQLEFMKDDSFEMEIDRMSETDEKTCALITDVLEVPEDLKMAFNAYCQDYIISEQGSTHPNGMFYCDEDVKTGIYNKLYYFYRPVFDQIEQEISINIELYIDPSYEDRSYIIAVVTRHKKRSLPVPFVAYQEGFKTWQPFFSKEKLPKDVYKEIFNIYGSTKAAVAAGLHANDILDKNLLVSLSGTQR